MLHRSCYKFFFYIQAHWNSPYMRHSFTHCPNMLSFVSVLSCRTNCVCLFWRDCTCILQWRNLSPISVPVGFLMVSGYYKFFNLLVVLIYNSKNQIIFLAIKLIVLHVHVPTIRMVCQIIYIQFTFLIWRYQINIINLQIDEAFISSNKNWTKFDFNSAFFFYIEKYCHMAGLNPKWTFNVQLILSCSWYKLLAQYWPYMDLLDQMNIYWYTISIISLRRGTWEESFQTLLVQQFFLHCFEQELEIWYCAVDFIILYLLTEP